jgi:hypothetical protein
LHFKSLLLQLAPLSRSERSACVVHKPGTYLKSLAATVNYTLSEAGLNRIANHVIDALDLAYAYFSRFLRKDRWPHVNIVNALYPQDIPNIDYHKTVNARRTTRILLFYR